MPSTVPQYSLQVFWRILLLLVVLCVGLAAAEPSRNVSSPEVNQGCTPAKECAEPMLMSVIAEGQNDSLYHVWGAHGAPTFLVAKTDLATSLRVNWTGFLAAEPNSLFFEGGLKHIFGIAIPNLILFNDTDDSGKLDNPDKAQIIVPMTDFTWKYEVGSKNSVREARIVLETITFRGESLPNDTKIHIEVTASGKNGRSSVLPHLIRTPNSAQLDMVLDNLVFDLNSTCDETFKKEDKANGVSGFINPRWAMDLIVFSSENITAEDDIQLSTQKSLDDENTPGVFHLDEITTPLTRMYNHGGYMQWRPVSYQNSKREISKATTPNVNANFTSLKEISVPLKESLAYAIFGEDLKEMTATTVISFGQSKDEFYTAHNYTTWTVALGEGYPPKETFSTMVIIVISLGIGIPSLMFIIGGIVIAHRKCHSSSNILIVN